MIKILFIDRDGVLIEEPSDFQIDSYEKFRLMTGVIPALIRLRDTGYQFVMISNQDGLGTIDFPQENFNGPHQLLLQILSSQGIFFRDIFIDRSKPGENSPNRKPGIGMVMHYIRDRLIDWHASAMVGDRETDMKFAENLGVKGFRIGPKYYSWEDIAHQLVDAPRVATVERITKETKIQVTWNLDRSTKPVITTGLGFFDHMLEQIGTHSNTSLSLNCSGDLHIDEHHTVEDSALALGQALKQALGDKRGITRYSFSLPMDEARASALLDLSGRPYFIFEGKFLRERVGNLATELVPHFFRSICEAAGINLHLTVQGDNAHHMIEACFKVFARALSKAIQRTGKELPSTKGML
jgi:imidazoleglycerol-phosphate dehydratase / histidinol-phosphatase